MFYLYVSIYCCCLKSKFNFLYIEGIGLLSKIFIVNFNCFLMKTFISSTYGIFYIPGRSILSLKLHYTLIIYYLLILRSLYCQLMFTKQSIKSK